MKEQFGLGFQDELKSAGREILSSVGDELKGAAKDKATAMIKEQFGLGFQDELKSAGREILGAVGDELKGAAKDKPWAKTAAKDRRDGDEEDEDDPEWIEFEIGKDRTKFLGHKMEDESRMREAVLKKKEGR